MESIRDFGFRISDCGFEHQVRVLSGFAETCEEREQCVGFLQGPMLVCCGAKTRFLGEFEPAVRLGGFFFDQSDFVGEVVAR